MVCGGGPAAFKDGRLEEALDLYSTVIHAEEHDRMGLAQSYCNRSLVHFKLQEYTHAMDDAVKALDLIHEGAQEEEGTVMLKSKAFHRHAQALVHLGDHVGALNVYKKALKECCGESTMPLQAATLLALENMPASWLAEYWTNNIARAEAPHPFSARDGVLLRKIPGSKHMEKERVKQCLVELLQKNRSFMSECQTCIVLLWNGRYSMKSCCAFVRGSVYMSIGDDGQGEKDATVALVYGPRTEEDARSCWAAAYALRSQCFEARGENVGAVLDILQAIEFCDDEDEEDRDGEVAEGQPCGVVQEYQAALTRLLPRIPEHYAKAIEHGCGYVGLQRMMAVERERMQPEYMKNRPKYYYYYEWMKKRIQDRHPSISEGVMDKLLTLDATELDLLLQYPQAIDKTVQDLESVLENQGPQVLESHQVPLLSWDTVQKLKSQESLQASVSAPAIAAP